MLHNLRIHQKFVAVLLLPLVVLTALAVGRIRSNVTESVRAGRVNTLVTFTVTLAGLAHELQKERDLSAVYVSDRSSGPQSVVVQRQLVDQVLARYQARLAAIDARRYSARVRDALAGVRRRLDGLGDQRRAIDGRSLDLAGSLRWYSDTVETLISVEDVAADEVDDRGVARDLETYTSLSRAKEQAAQERGAIAGALASGDYKTSDAQRLAAASALQSSWLGRFQATATASQRALYSRTLTGPDVQRADSLRATALTAQPGAPLSLRLNTWFFATSATIDLLRKVEVALADETASASRASASAADRRVVTDAAGIAALVVILALCMVMAGSMARPLRRLERTARDVADRRLPGVIERLQRGEVVDPDEEAPLEVASKDEIGQVARAFNEVHRVATRVATEQAALRKSIGDLFHNLARRSQSLVDRQLELIDELERGEADPNRLEELFRIDHLATRMRRNAENLVVLSGTEQLRRWSEPVPLPDVIEAAVAEVEEYARVRVTTVGELMLSGQAASDVAHLLAELVENATSFSPPSTTVEVVGSPVASGYVLEIEDRGLGMTDAELIEANQRLVTPSAADITVSRMMGFHVVGRLAARHDIGVQLRHSWYGGVTALVLLPDHLLGQPFEPGPLAVPRAANGAGGREPFPLAEVNRTALTRGVYLPLRRHAAQPSNRAGGGDAAEADEQVE
jgi:HAMP domain-containing protein/anti-sigma regulatory factor (Ser/Thr protein kinase)